MYQKALNICIVAVVVIVIFKTSEHVH